MSRFFTVVAGLALFACTVAASIRFEVPRMEADLSARAREAAAKANLGWLEIGAVGQTLRLTGNAPDYTARNEAELLALGVWGVTGVDNQIVLVGSGESCVEEVEAFRGGDPLEFATGSATIAPEGERLLERVAAVARNCDVQVVVTLAARSGATSRSTRIDRARLDAVHRFLVRNGVPSALLVGGSANPQILDGRPRHERRVEVWVMEEAA